MTALVAALSLQGKVEQYGAYAGVAAVFGLGVLSLLYFAQAREVKRLREWAGRAPERAAELEARAIAAAEEKLAEPQVVAQPAPVPVPAAAVAVAAANGAGAAVPGPRPTQVAPLPGVPASRPDAPLRAPGAPSSLPAAATAAATAAGARAAATAAAPGGPGGGSPSSAGGVATLPATAAASVPAVTGGPPPTAAPGAPAGPEEAAPAPINGGGARTAAGGAAATAAGRAQAPPVPHAAPVRASASQATVPPRTAAGRSRRPGAQPSRRPSRGTIIGAIGAAAVIAAAVIVVFVVVLGGNDTKPTAKPNTLAPAASAPSSANGGSAGGAAGASSAKVNRGQVRVAVLNGTTFTGLARSASDKLTKAGFQPGVVTNDTTNQTRSATAIFYGPGQRNAALIVARIVGIGRDAVQKLDANTRSVAGEDANVVVSVGADQAR